MIVKIQDIKPLMAQGRIDPAVVLAELRELALSVHWQTREVAATALVELGKDHPKAILRNALRWAKSSNPNIRRAACEGLRGIVKLDPEGVRPVLEALQADSELYVKKSVANVFRNASSRSPDFVLAVCRQWAQSNNTDTHWIIKAGLRKLKESRSSEVTAILGSV